MCARRSEKLIWMFPRGPILLWSNRHGYMDVISKVRDGFELPVAAYNVSGEYAMVKAAAANGWIEEQRTTLEILTGIKRAGAQIIITYHALEAAEWL